MTRLLASVRDPREAELAMRGGADWIDIKDPDAGALGAARDEVIVDIIRAVAQRHPVSATIGDSWDDPVLIADQVAHFSAFGLDYIKIGVRARNMRRELHAAVRAACTNRVPIIAVCMAEAAPAASDLAALAAAGVAGVMLDTAEKSGPGLTVLHDRLHLAAFVAEARALGLLSGLAGQLRVGDIPAVYAAGADYLGFRGALCAGQRTDAIGEAAVRRVRAALEQARGQHRAEQVEVA